MVSKTAISVGDPVIFDPTPLRRAKAIKRLKVVQIAQRSGTSIGTVSNVLRGTTPNSGALGNIADVLGVDLAECFPKTESVA